MSGGYTPSVHLFSQSRGKLAWDAGRHAFLPERSAERERSAGCCRGIEGLELVLNDGAQAGLAAARAAGCEGEWRPLPVVSREFAMLGVPGALRHHGPQPPARAFVDFQNDVTTRDLALAAREGFESIEHVKRYTTTGMATDQGKTSNLNGLAIAVVTWRARSGWVPFLLIAGVFVYTTFTNMFERPEGIKIASIFIATIVFTSLVSRTLRSTELRVHDFELDDMAQAFINGVARRGRAIRIIANRPGTGLPKEYEDKMREASDSHHVPPDEPVLFLEIQPGDASEFSDILRVQGVEVGGHLILRSKSPAIPNAIAALLLYIRDQTGVIPHVYFGWTEGNPIAYLMKFLAFGEGDTAPVTREVLRQFEADPQRRPRVLVG